MALAFKNRYPLMFNDYKNACDLGKVKPGVLHIWETPDNKFIINFPTKRHWRNKSRYEDIKSGLEALKIFLENRPNLKVALPALGCGHGGLDWKIVSTMIQEELFDIKANILVFEPKDTHNLNIVSNSNKQKKQDIKTIPHGYLPEHLKGYYSGNLLLLKNNEKIIISANIESEKENEILYKIFKKLSENNNNITLSIIYKNPETNLIIKNALDFGHNIIIYIPFGINHKNPLLDNYKKNEKILLISLFSPNQEWREKNNIKLCELLLSLGHKFLVTEHTPDWIAPFIKNEIFHKFFYFIKYEHTRAYLNNFDHTKTFNLIGKSVDTQEPKLGILFNHCFSTQEIKGADEITLNFDKLSKLLIKLEEYNIQNDILYKIELSNADPLVIDVINNILKDFE